MFIVISIRGVFFLVKRKTLCLMNLKNTQDEYLEFKCRFIDEICWRIGVKNWNKISQIEKS